MHQCADNSLGPCYHYNTTYPYIPPYQNLTSIEVTVSYSSSIYHIYPQSSLCISYCSFEHRYAR